MNVPLHTIEICAGVGMLGEGLRAGLARMGIDTRVCCYLEREAYPASVLAARMEEGSLDAAPIWSDILTFDAAAWAGAVDCVVAGFPCQDLSIAGRRPRPDGTLLVGRLAAERALAGPAPVDPQRQAAANGLRWSKTA